MEFHQKKNVLFIGGPSGRDQWMFEISKEFKRREDIKSHFLCISEGSSKYFEKKGIKQEDIHSFVFDENQKPLEKIDIDFIKKAEKRYCFKSLDVWQITAPRKKKRMKKDIDFVLSWVEYTVKNTEEMINKFNPSYALLQAPASFFMVIIYRILLEKKVNILEITNARIPNRFTINNNLKSKWPLLEKEYKKIKERDLSENEKSLAKEFIASFKEKQFKPDDSTKVKESLSKKINKYKFYLELLKQRKELPDLKQFIWPIKNKIVDMSNTFEDFEKKEEKYVYYPLHTSPEASTSIYGKWFVNQTDLIEAISKSLPCDYKLYVKEHPLNYSKRKRSFYHKIKVLPNVRLITPHANSNDVLKNSSLVLTITGTVGWESILLQKPVIVFGDVYYSEFDQVTKVKNMDLLGEKILENLDKTVDENETYKFINSMFYATYPGIGSYPDDCQMRSLSSKNVSLLVDGIQNYINSLEEEV
jgi:hypothetical protein